MADMPAAAQVLADFVPTKDFFVGIDSDGCAMDAMDIKHLECFTPASILAWDLQPVSTLARETAIFVNLGIPYYTGTTLPFIASILISTIQLGSTVDYAILFSDRYQEFRETLGRKEAVAATVSAVTTSVSTTGSAMAVVGFLMGAISTNQLLGQLGNFLGVKATQPAGADHCHAETAHAALLFSRPRPCLPSCCS